MHKGLYIWMREGAYVKVKEKGERRRKKKRKRKKGERERERREKREKEKEERERENRVRKFRAKIQRDLSPLQILLCPSINKVRGVKLSSYILILISS